MVNIRKYPLAAYQPFRLLYQLGAAASIAAHLPFWIVMGLVSALRPNRQWSFIQTIMVRMLRASLHTDSTIGLGESEAQLLAPPKGGGGRPLRGDPALRRRPLHWAPCLRPSRQARPHRRHLEAGAPTTTNRIRIRIRRQRGAGEEQASGSRGNPYIQALGHPFRAGCPLLVCLGAAEILSTDGAAWVAEMRGLEGEGEGGGANRVEVYYEDDAPHDTLLIGDVVKMEDSAAKVAVRIGEFIDKN